MRVTMGLTEDRVVWIGYARLYELRRIDARCLAELTFSEVSILSIRHSDPFVIDLSAINSMRRFASHPTVMHREFIFAFLIYVHVHA